MNRYLNLNTGIPHDAQLSGSDLCGKTGDTLYKISQYHHVSVTDILLANPYVNVYNLQIGDELCIPVGKMAMTGEADTKNSKFATLTK